MAAASLNPMDIEYCCMVFGLTRLLVLTGACRDGAVLLA